MRTPLAIVGILAIAALTRTFGIENRSFWFDEAFFWRLSQFSIGEVIRRTAADNYPVLYPLLLKGWSALFGCSPAGLRALSVVCGVATVYGVYLFCIEVLRGDDDESRARRNGATGLLAAALVAVSVFQIRWSWDVKMMTLGAMLNVYGSWALFRALRLQTTAAWLAYAGLALAFLHTHYYALFSVFVQCSFTAVLFLQRARWNLVSACSVPSCRGWLLSVLILVIGFAPWVPTFIRQHDRDRAAGLRRPVTVQRVVKTPFSLFCEPEPEDANTSEDTAAVAFVLCDLLLLASLAPLTRGACYTFVAATGPWAMGIAVSMADTNVFEVRYLAFAQPFWLIATAIAVSRVPRVACRRILAALLIGCSLFAHARFWSQAEFELRPGARAAAEYLEQNRRPGEVVVVCSQTNYYPLLYHSASASGIWLYDDEKNVRRHSWGSAIILPSELLSWGALEALACPRVWVVDSENASWGPLRVPRVLGWEMTSQQRFRGIWGFEGDYVVTEYETAGR